VEKINKILITVIVGALVLGGFIVTAVMYKPYGQNSGYTAKSYTAKSTKSTSSAKCQASDNTIVTKVIDGDTVVVEGGSHVRLLGIDADEKDHPCYDAARLRLEALVLSKPITLERDVTDTDIYGRCLRTIFLGSQNVDLQMVQEGLAVARFYDPDTKYKPQITAAEKQAIDNKVGCKWSGV